MELHKIVNLHVKSPTVIDAYLAYWNSYPGSLRVRGIEWYFTLTYVCVLNWFCIWSVTLFYLRRYIRATRYLHRSLREVMQDLCCTPMYRVWPINHQGCYTDKQFNKTYRDHKNNEHHSNGEVITYIICYKKTKYQTYYKNAAHCRM